MEEKQWFLYVVDHHEGPFSVSDIQDLLKKGEAKNSSFVWREGLEDWLMMSEVPDFRTGGSGGEGHGAAAYIVTSPDPANKNPSAKPVIFDPSGSIKPAVEQGAGPLERDLSDLPETAIVWCLNANRSFTGPHSMRTIARMVNDGKISVKDSVWKEGWNGFAPISSLPEFMMRVHATQFNVKKNSAAAAMGLMGSNVTKKNGFISGLKKALKAVLLLSLLAAGLYQLRAHGYLDLAYKKAREMNMGSLAGVLGNAKAKALPVLLRYSSRLPDPVKRYIGFAQLPEGVSPNDAPKLNDAAMADLAAGKRGAVAVLNQNIMTPRFVVASNQADGTPLKLVLRGKERTLLNASEYLSEQTVVLSGKVAVSQAFVQEGEKPLPQGEYTLTVLAGAQSILVESLFLGGPRDAIYEQRAREFNERLAAWQKARAQEALQIVATLESMANESANKFFGFSKMRPGTGRAVEWRKYSARYRKLSDQLAVAIDKMSSGVVEGTRMKAMINGLKQGYDVSEQLHKAESEYMNAPSAKGKGAEKTGAAGMEQVRGLAAQLVSSLNAVKAGLAK